MALPESATKHASGVNLALPPKPFQPIPADGGDAAWKNHSSGSVISYLSECGGSEQSLQSLRDEVIRGLPQIKLLGDQMTKVNGQSALRSSVSHQSNDKETVIDLIVFNKNSCSYVLTLVGKPAAIKTDTPAFETFLAGFQAP